MLNSLFAATGLTARALRTSLRLALLPLAVAITASPAIAQISETTMPASPIPNGLPQARETTGKWSLPDSPPANVIVLPGVSQADIDRVSARRPERPKPNASQPARAIAPLQPVPAQDRYFQNRYVRSIPIYPGYSYPAPLAATTCGYSPSSTFSYQAFSDLNNRSLPLPRYGDSTVVVTERTVTERTVVLNNSGLDQNQVIVSRTRYPQQLGLSNNRTFVRRGSNRFDRLANCEAINRY